MAAIGPQTDEYVCSHSNALDTRSANESQRERRSSTSRPFTLHHSKAAYIIIIHPRCFIHMSAKVTMSDAVRVEVVVLAVRKVMV